MNTGWHEAAVLCEAVAKTQAELPIPAQVTISVGSVLAALDEFMECVRYMNTRRSRNSVLQIESEADVQDAIYLMLRPWLTDLTHENPTDRVGNRFSIKDFLAPSLKTVIEAKYVRSTDHGKNIGREMHDDIEVYRRHPKCDHLVFFVYDPNSEIPDVRALRTDIEAERIYGGRPLTSYLIVKP